MFDASAKSCKMNEVQPEGLAKCISVVILPRTASGVRDKGRIGVAFRTHSERNKISRLCLFEGTLLFVKDSIQMGRYS